MKFHLPIPIITLLIATTLQAEITLDGTLGPKIALEGPNYDISAKLGQQRGSNLFHSFDQFNINVEEIATFSGPDNINNIISRVTGGSPSSIDGTLSSTINGADVYLINPAGMMFGPNARLDIPGSFHASTADTLRFNDGSEFNARNPQNNLLTIAPVSAFGFLTDSPAALKTERSRLATPAGETISLIGGNVQINQGLLTANLGRFNIASVASKGDVTLLSDDLTLSAKPGEISLKKLIMTTAGGGDTAGIFIRAGDFFLDDATVTSNTKGITNSANINVQAETLTVTQGGGFASNTRSDASGGQIKIEVAGLTKFSGWKTLPKGTVKKSGIRATSSSKGKGHAGTIELKTGTLELKDGATISATTLGQGQGGNISIRAVDSISLSGFGSQGEGSSIAANTRGKMENAGQGGTIFLNAKELSLRDGAQIGANTIGIGKGGEINIKVKGDVSLSGKDHRENRYRFPSRISTTSTSFGDGGKINLEAKRLNIVDGTSIIASSIGTGQGGNIKIDVSNLVKLKGSHDFYGSSSITAQTQGEMPDAGNGGTIELTTDRLQLSDGAQISTSTFGLGQGGQLHVKVAKNAVFSGEDKSEEAFSSGLFTDSNGEMENAGKGGILTLEAGDLHITDNAQINAATYGPATGGSVRVRAKTIKLTKGGKITALSDEALGNAGEIELILTDKLIIRNGFIETKAESADGGNLSITSPSYIYLIDSRITTSVSEEFGGGGNITASPKFVVLDNAQMFAKAKKGAGGNINVTTTGIYNFTGEAIETIINASSEFGVDGVVVIDTPDNGAEEGLFALPSTPFDATALMNTPCNQQVANKPSRFILVPSEGATNAVADLFASGPLLSQIKEVKQVRNSEGTAHHFMKVALLMGCQSDSNVRENDNETVPQKSRVVPEHLLF